MSLNESIVEDAALEWFGEQCRVAPTLIPAFSQHCALKWVMSERMTNQTLRERFHLPESKVASVSQVIAAAIDAKMIKADEKVGGSRKFARYLPFWA
jgi:ATP-dependent DNA helicase RecG